MITMTWLFVLTVTLLPAQLPAVYHFVRSDEHTVSRHVTVNVAATSSLSP
jgi:hypothetical protein